jgi:hypothetical protein
MHVELLRTIPTSGSVQERHYDVSAGPNAWVRFFDEASGLEWVGVFGSGEPSRFFAAIPFGDDDGQTVLVVAGGQGYVVDAASGELFRRTPWFYSQAAVPVPASGFVIVADDTEMWAAGRTSDARIWRAEPRPYDHDEVRPAHRLALDGIVIDQATPEEVRGKVWEGDGWYAFRVVLQTREFVRGPFLTAEWEQFAIHAPAV